MYLCVSLFVGCLFVCIIPILYIICIYKYINLSELVTIDFNSATKHNKQDILLGLG